MNKTDFAAVAFATAVALSASVMAAAPDYVFEPVSAQIKRGDNVIVSVRLRHKTTGKPVTDAVVVQTRIDMAPDGMATMEAPLTAVPSSEPGVYSFKAEISMAGRWLLSISARVQGEPEPVVGRVIFTARR